MAMMCRPVPRCRLANSNVAVRRRVSSCRCQPSQQETVLPDAPSLVAAPESPITLSPTRNPPYEIIAALAGAGALETTYLTAAKLGLLESLACPTSGCESVLSSGYASLLGVPLPMFGFLAYGSVAILALAGVKGREENASKLGVINQLLAAGSGALATTSAYLMYILFQKLGGAECVWCFGSAALSFGILTATFGSASTLQRVNWATPALLTAAVTFSLLYTSWRSVTTIPDDFFLPYSPPVVSNESTAEGVALARKLSEAGAKFYGAFWCSHCHDQKEIFGKAAAKELPYVECYPEGWRKGTVIAPACDAAGIKSFPSWIINGQLIEGEQEFDELELLLAGSTSK